MIDFQPLASGNFEFAGVEAPLVENGGVDVGDVVAVLDGVNTYFTRQPPPGTLYAARAKALEGNKVVASVATPATTATGGSP